MSSRIIILLACLMLAACAPPLPTATLNPEPTPEKTQMPTPRDDQAASEPTPVIGQFTPADLPLAPLAWGSPVDGKSGDQPEAHLILPEEELDSAWLFSLPEEMQNRLQEIHGTQQAGDKPWLVVLYGGMQPCPAYHVAVEKAEVQERTLQITWQVLPPEPGTGCASVQAYPYLILWLRDAAQYADGVEFNLAP